VLSSKARVLAKVKPLVRGFIRSKSGLTKAAGRARGGQMARDFSRAHLTRAVEASLKRLRTDTIDIYQLHSPTGSHLRNTDAFETLADLKQAGKIRAYGVSLLSWDDLPLCLNQGVSWAQVDADLFGNTPHHNWHEMAAGDGLLLIARQVFASGLLTRTPDSLTADDFDGDQAKLDHTRRMLNSLSGTGDPFGTIMRYFMHHSPFGAFLFATTRTTNLRTNLGALCMPEFIGEDFEVIKTLFPTPRSPEL
jgi:aryl-alcohol dehydrogenase-like predicted oxidoreductase